MIAVGLEFINISEKHKLPGITETIWTFSKVNLYIHSIFSNNDEDKAALGDSRPQIFN